MKGEDQASDDELAQEVDLQPVEFDRDQVEDLVDHLEVLLTDPASDLPPEERREWEHVQATAERLIDEFEPPK
jgi:hypothetical protein